MMGNLNSILIEGNMARDPQYRVTPEGTPVCTFCIATNRYFRMKGGLEREVSFFDVEAWARLAEICNQLGKKGRGVRVVGRLRQDRWQGEDDKPCVRITIVAKHIEFRPEFIKIAKADEELAEIEQDVLPDEEMTDESRVVEVTDAVV